MALGICRDCHEKMSSNADFCPHCGSTSQPLKSIRYEEEYEDKIITCNKCGGDGVMFVLYEKSRVWVSYLFPIFGGSWSDWSFDIPTRYNTQYVRGCDVEMAKRTIEAKSDKERIVKVHWIEKKECVLCGGSGKLSDRITHKRIITEEF